MKNLFGKTRMPRLRLGLFALMFVLVLMMGSRVVEVAQQIAKGNTPDAFAPVVAEEKAADTKKEDMKPAEAAKPDAEAEKKAAEEKAADAKAETAAKAEPAPAAAPASPGPEAAPHVEDPVLTEPENYTDAEVNILKKLSERRQELDKRGREIDQREALLRVTEQRVDKKIGDLKNMQEQIRKVLGDADKAQLAQEASMVKIYETMKPKDAAKIFENLDMPVLMSVVSRMKEARVAPILGEMDPVKAKELTTALMEKKPLPPAP
jgi:flagellar motility protein MotE (MotC chaperone)